MEKEKNIKMESLYLKENFSMEKNGMEKEEKLNIIIFEGEYLNGKRNGKGYEYNYKKKLIFKGEYLNGERNEKEK